MSMRNLATRFRALAPAADYVSLRTVEERSRTVSVRKDVPEPPRRTLDAGAMVTVFDGDGVGHAATSDLSDAGLRRAVEKALSWARLTRGKTVFQGTAPSLPSPRGSRAPVPAPAEISTASAIERLMAESRSCGRDPALQWTGRRFTDAENMALGWTRLVSSCRRTEPTIPQCHGRCRHEQGTSDDGEVRGPGSVQPNPLSMDDGRLE